MNLNNYSAVLVSISGGKDSQTIMGVMAAMARQQQYMGDMIAIHADTGAEWKESLPHCQLLAKEYQMRLEVAVPFRALPEHIEHRGMWPSSACRYCTSDCKRNPIDKAIRGCWSADCGKDILVVTGERRQESSHRAKLAEIENNKRLTAGTRTVTTYRPILDMTLDQVWKHISDSGIPRHVAYDRGNERLSCAMCVLAKDADIRRGAEARPDLAEQFLKFEATSGHTFKNGKSLKQILEAK